MDVVEILPMAFMAMKSNPDQNTRVLKTPQEGLQLRR